MTSRELPVAAKNKYQVSNVKDEGDTSEPAIEQLKKSKNEVAEFLTELHTISRKYGFERKASLIKRLFIQPLSPNSLSKELKSCITEVSRAAYALDDAGFYENKEDAFKSFYKLVSDACRVRNGEKRDKLVKLLSLAVNEISEGHAASIGSYMSSSSYSVIKEVVKLSKYTAHKLNSTVRNSH